MPIIVPDSQSMPVGSVGVIVARIAASRIDRTAHVCRAHIRGEAAHDR
ncbi:hypothetical protein ACOI1H_10220 [Loktanella sp. DJP18]